LQRFNCHCRRGGMAGPFVLGSSSLLDVPRPGAPRPFSSSPVSSVLVFVLVFCCITFLFVSVFFCSFCRSSPRQFRCFYPLLGFFRTPTATSFHRALLCTGSANSRSVSFPVFLFACIQLYFFSFHCISFVICL
jgi:hypothetical protein